jgi:hypothetical protein
LDKLIVRYNIVKDCTGCRAFFKNSSVREGGGGVYKKGPYYIFITECGEITDGVDGTKFGVVSYVIVWGSECILPQKMFVFFHP